MPILHLQFSATVQGPDGQQVPAPPRQGLLMRGPVVQVTLSIFQPIAEQLLQQGQTLPPPVSGLALIDTGATFTCVDDQAMRGMGIAPVDVVEMASASHAATQQNVYPVHIEVLSGSLHFNVERSIGATLAPQGLIALIGRDVLSICMLVYNGLAGEITLSI